MRPELTASAENPMASKDDTEASPVSMRFQLLATLLVVCCAAAGAFVGILFSTQDASEDLISWFALPGDLFIRALKCAVLPLVFVNVIIAVIQMVEAGKAGAVGKNTVVIYFLTTFIASIEGLIAVAAFQGMFSSEEEEVEPTFVHFLCPFNDAVLIQDQVTNVVSCLNNTANLEKLPPASEFEVDNENEFFVTTSEDFDAISFSDTLQDGVFRKLIPDNIVGDFAAGNFVGVVMFGIAFGAATQGLARKPKVLLDFLNDVNAILVLIIEYVIYLTPIAVFSLIVGALGNQEDLGQTFADIGILVVAAVCAIAAHMLVVYPALFYYFTKSNPYAYMRHLFPAQIFAFSCASSAATLPVTARCVTATGLVPPSIRDFVLPIGATVNMDGTALYFPAALVFLAKTSGLSSGAAEYFLIVLVSTIGSAGAAPVPNAGLVLIITAFNTVYGTTGTPLNFGIIVGIDWLMDRFQTALNVTGDAMVCRIVAYKAGYRKAQDLAELQTSEVEEDKKEDL